MYFFFFVTILFFGVDSYISFSAFSCMCLFQFLLIKPDLSINNGYARLLIKLVNNLITIDYTSTNITQFITIPKEN